MASWIRRLVSQNRRRYTEDGFDLDLCYVTDRIIAMGLPAQGGQGFFRNPLSETVKLLQTKHKDCYKVYNLCAEHVYDPEKIGGMFKHFPFEDHQTPPLALIKAFCQDAEQWLSEHPKNVIAVHCKAGKGRTGIMICCLLVCMNICANAEEAMWLFGDKRTTNQKGVTIASQRRYIQYFDEIFNEGLIIPQPKTVQLKSLRIAGLPKSTLKKLVVKISARDSQSNRLKVVGFIKDHAGSSKGINCFAMAKAMPFEESYQVFMDEEYFVALERGAYGAEHWIVQGDVKIQFFVGSATKSHSLFYAWVNTAFLHGGQFVFDRSQLDKVRSWVTDDVELEVKFSFIEPCRLVCHSGCTLDELGSDHGPAEEVTVAEDGNGRIPSFDQLLFDEQMEKWGLNRTSGSTCTSQVELVKWPRFHHHGRRSRGLSTVLSSGVSRTGSLPNSLGDGTDGDDELQVKQSGFSWMELSDMMRAKWYDS